VSYKDRYATLGALAGKVRAMVDAAGSTLSRMMSHARDDPQLGRGHGGEDVDAWGGGGSRKGGGIHRNYRR
jgi:hypothetical protein